MSVLDSAEALAESCERLDPFLGDHDRRKRRRGWAPMLIVVFALFGAGCVSGDGDPATVVTDTTATLNAHGAAGSEPATSYFEYGTTTGYGTRTPVRSWPAGTNRAVSEQVSGLRPSTTYHFRACAKSASEPRYGCGRDLTFTTQPPASPPPSGEPMPVGDLPGWRQVFTDDFTQPVPLGSFPTAVSSKWWAYPYPWSDTSENGTYWPERVLSVANGKLNYSLRTQGGVHLVAAPVPIPPGASPQRGLLYGRYAVRFRADQVPGYKTAWLLWPDSDEWPRDGEIDFPEGDLVGRICAFSHRQGATSGSDQDAFCSDKTYSSWRTAVIEWTNGRVRFLLDGELLGTAVTRVPNTPMHWVLQTETTLDGVPPPASAAGTVEIDWVAVYRPA